MSSCLSFFRTFLPTRLSISPFPTLSRPLSSHLIKRSSTSRRSISSLAALSTSRFELGTESNKGPSFRQTNRTLCVETWTRRGYISRLHDVYFFLSAKSARAFVGSFTNITGILAIAVSQTTPLTTCTSTTTRFIFRLIRAYTSSLTIYFCATRANVTFNSSTCPRTQLSAIKTFAAMVSWIGAVTINRT